MITTKKDQDNLARLYLERFDGTVSDDNPYGYDDNSGEYDHGKSLDDNVEYLFNAVKNRKFENALNVLNMIEYDLQVLIGSSVEPHF